MKSKKIIIVIFLVALEIGIFFLSIKSLNNKYEKLDVNSDQNNVFAFYVQNGNDYVKSLESTFPDLEEYTYNSAKSYCVDNTGNNYDNASITYTNNEVQVVTEKSVYCYLYFDILKTLYNVIKHDSDSSINTPIAEEYTGAYNFNPNKTIYYYSATQPGLDHDNAVNSIMNHWNVLFGGFCWQMLRTTESGGVKLLYNGEPTAQNSCTDGRNNYIGESQYNEDNDLFSKVGYTFNNNLPYELDSFDFKTIIYTGIKTNSFSSGMTFASSYSYNSINGYTLDNPKSASEFGGTSNLSGTYSKLNDTDKFSIYYIVYASNSSIYYIKLQNNESLSSKEKYFTVSKNATKNNNGTYTLNGYENIKNTEIRNLSKYIDYYLCEGNNISTCNPIVITNESVGNWIGYVRDKYNYQFGYSFRTRPVVEQATDNKGIYALEGKSGQNGTLVQVVNETDYKSKIANARYTCFNSYGICDDLYYVYSADKYVIYYINLKDDGETITEAVDKMIGGVDTNKVNSIIKTYIDSWYINNIFNTKYRNYIDINEVYCNDRRIESYGSFNPDNTINSNPSFEVSEKSRNLNCPMTRDAFTYKYSNVGNKQLDYPIGLMTAQEMYLVDKMDNSSPLRGNGNSSYYLMTPYSGLNYGINTTELSSVFVIDNGSLGGSRVKANYKVRPAIALNPGIEYTSGNGSKNSPFIIE